MKYITAAILLATFVRVGSDNLGDDQCSDPTPCFHLIGSTVPNRSVVENWEPIKTERVAPKGKIKSEKAPR